MTIQSQILQNQTEMLKELGDVKQDIGEIKGTLEALVPRVNGLEKKQNTCVSKSTLYLIILISGIIFIPALLKLLEVW